MTSTKRLIIPSAPELDNLPLEEVANALEDCGERISVESLNWPAEFPYRPLTVVTAAHSATNLYLDFLVRCNYLRAVNYTDNTEVSEDSCVQFYISFPDESGRYLALECNCIGILKAEICYPDGSRQLLPQEELNLIGRYPSVGSRPFQEVEGSFIWSVVLSVPMKLFGIETASTDITTRGNFNKCASSTSQPHFLSWSPISTAKPDFHQPEAFGTIEIKA